MSGDKKSWRPKYGIQYAVRDWTPLDVMRVSAPKWRDRLNLWASYIAMLAVALVPMVGFLPELIGWRGAIGLMMLVAIPVTVLWALGRAVGFKIVALALSIAAGMAAYLIAALVLVSPL